MRFIISFFMLMFVFVSHPQQVSLNFTKDTDPFKWSVTSIEFQQTKTLIHITVKNTAFGVRYFNALQSCYICSDIDHDVMTANDNSFRTVSGASNISLRHNETLSYVLTFPSSDLICAKEISLRVGSCYLGPIDVPELSLNDINKQMMSWEQYYNAHKKVKLTHQNIEEVKKSILKDVENWQQKGEFESTSAWQSRVNDSSRQQYISEVTKKFSDLHEEELNSLRREQVRLADDYEIYKEDLLSSYYQYKSKRASKAFVTSDFELMPYDADNETFLIHSKSFGDILLPVPVADAPLFKQNWATIVRSITPEYVPNRENVALNKLIFSNFNKKYIYDSHTVAKYAITDVNYNFAPIEIAEINFSDLKIDGDVPLPNNVPSTIFGISSQEKLLSQNTVKPERKYVSASEKSDVDVSIPQNSTLKNCTTFAIIIANENYDAVSPVPFAQNDGAILSKYLVNTLGLPEEHVKIYNNATFGNMAGALKHISNLSLAFGDKLNLILYYAGHGVPNEQTKQCMLLPIDGDALIPETCYDVDKLYTTLGRLNANSIVVLMDACFSGSTRGEGMLFASRSVKIKSNHAEPKGKMVILSASQGDETAFPFEKEQHGMFTFYLLKYLQQNKGNVTLGDLSEYLIEQVKRQSVVSSGKLQTPMVQYSPEVEESWRSWRLAQ